MWASELEMGPTPVISHPRPPPSRVYGSLRNHDWYMMEHPLKSVPLFVFPCPWRRRKNKNAWFWQNYPHEILSPPYICSLMLHNSAGTSFVHLAPPPTHTHTVTFSSRGEILNCLIQSQQVPAAIPQRSLDVDLPLGGWLPTPDLWRCSAHTLEEALW